MTDIYINGTGCISPQLTADSLVFLPEVRAYTEDRMLCIEPDYTSFFDPGTIRRMGRVAKFATAAAFLALRDAGIQSPAAISTGTGFGLLDNSGKFLKSVIEQDEAVVSPTAFIQSTHNTVGGIIALMTACHGHNNTFSQKGNSFESALTDAIMLMEANETDNILVGGFDELTDYSLAVMRRLQMLRSAGTGTTAGEGAAFFLLSKERTDKTYCRLIDARAIFKPNDTAHVKDAITSFLEENKIPIDQLDIIVSGISGDEHHDPVHTEINQSLFSSQTILRYKHLSGEYMTSSAFACWLAARMIQTGQVPDSTMIENRGRTPKTILIHNSYCGDHSLILLTTC